MINLSERKIKTGYHLCCPVFSSLSVIVIHGNNVNYDDSFYAAFSALRLC